MNAFVTNGYQSPEAVAAMRGLIDAANVDLKSFSDEFYREHCGARLQPVLDTIGAMHQAGIHVEVTTLVVPGQNDSEPELASFLAGISRDLPWHVTRFHPDYQVTWIEPTPVETIRRAVQIGREAGLRFVYAGNLRLPEAKDTLCRASAAPRWTWRARAARSAAPRCPSWPLERAPSVAHASERPWLNSAAWSSQVGAWSRAGCVAKSSRSPGARAPVRPLALADAAAGRSRD